ncbi:YpbS family protein [Bacillus sp. DJP31]|uniref:YpbS family protein n=1 Tax=Bacillus sp. DJP31 TaxID=3409789 RepID=UPI003BB5F343
MNVHEAITKHSSKQHQILKDFLQLDHQRELYIEEAVSLCKQKVEFSTEKINIITKEINELAKQGVVPQRKLVTIEMVKDYAFKLGKTK